MSVVLSVHLESSVFVSGFIASLLGAAGAEGKANGFLDKVVGVGVWTRSLFPCLCCTHYEAEFGNGGFVAPLGLLFFWRAGVLLLLLA